ncbi:MAG: hypothetical protein A2068_14710 [Ignavibacteria bacterium GWB2_35_6b]|nr:MAG: hypothetical protein A2068_14710 [Ignavibacteria bacterium GWB2_35_6b]
MDEQKPKEDEFENSLNNFFEEEIVEDEFVEEPRQKSLSKIKKGSLIAGVCTGIANYFGIEPVIIRVLFAVSIFLGGWGIIFYIIAALLLPSELTTDENSNIEIHENSYAKTIAGSLFVFIGIFFIADNFGFMNYLFFFGLPKFLLLPVTMILTGGFILFKINDFLPVKSGTKKTKFYRSRNDKRLLGVCGGLADYLNVESNNLRMLWIIFSFLTIGAGIVLYIFIAVFTEKEAEPELELQ